MNVYRLDPIAGHPSWKLSKEKDTVWAAAPSESAARALVTSRAGVDPANSANSPWNNPAAATCVLDSSIKLLNEGDVVRSDGSEVDY